MCMWVWPAEFEADSLCTSSSRCKTSSHAVPPRQHELLLKANIINILQAELHCTLLVTFGEPALSIAHDTHLVLQHMCTQQPSHSIRDYIAPRRSHCQAVSLPKHRLLRTNGKLQTTSSSEAMLLHAKVTRACSSAVDFAPC